MAIPFKTLRETAIVDVAGIAVPRRGCLTVAEEQAMRDLGAELEQLTETMTPLQADLEIKQRVATILIQSRLDRSWTLDKTKASEWEFEVDGQNRFLEPDMAMMDELYLFFLGEQRRWKDLEQDPAEETEAEEKPKKRSTGAKSTGNSN